MASDLTRTAEALKASHGALLAALSPDARQEDSEAVKALEAAQARLRGGEARHSAQMALDVSPR